MRPKFIAAVALAGTVGLAIATAPATGRPPARNTLTAAARPSVIVFGQSTTVSGKLGGANNGGVAVVLAQDPFPYGDGFLALARGTTANNGNYSFHLVPALNTNYRVRAKGLTAFTGVRVHARVTEGVSDSTPTVGQFVRFFGSVAPRFDGRVVLIQRQTSTGGWSTVRRTLLRHTSIGNRSLYSTRIPIRSTGKYRARFSTSGPYLTGTSATRTLTVH
jgi:hypothetical protein